MARFFDSVRETIDMDRGMREDLERPVGQTVQWYEFDSATVDPLFEEGTRMWRPPKSVPTMGIERYEGEEDISPEGQYTEDTIHFNVRAKALVDAGVSDVYDAQSHINDRVIWDQFVWDVRHYQPAGRVMTVETVIGVEAVRVHSDELASDPQFLPEPNTLGSVTDKLVRQVTDPLGSVADKTIRQVAGG